MQSTIDKSKRENSHQLNRSARHKQATINRARELAATAQLTQKKLLRQLPSLQKAAEAALAAPDMSDDERAAAQRAYLEAQQSLQRCEQVFQIARRQRIEAANL